jgi:hypothetical protein
MMDENTDSVVGIEILVIVLEQVCMYKFFWEKTFEKKNLADPHRKHGKVYTSKE